MWREKQALGKMLKKKRGFLFIEILVAIAIGAVALKAVSYLHYELSCLEQSITKRITALDIVMREIERRGSIAYERPVLPVQQQAKYKKQVFIKQDVCPVTFFISRVPGKNTSGKDKSKKNNKKKTLRYLQATWGLPRGRGGRLEMVCPC